MSQKLLIQIIPALIVAALMCRPMTAQQPVDDDDEFDPRLGTYHYNVKWQGVTAGKAELNVSQENGYYRVSVNAKTRDAIDWLYKLRYYGEVKMTTEEMQPVETLMKQQRGRRTKDTSIVFHEDGTIEAVEVKVKGDKERTKVRKIQSTGFTLDPFSATFLARRLDWEKGEAEVFEVFSGKRSYLIKLNCQAKCTIKVAGEQREAWLITSEYRRMDEPDEDFQDSETIVYLSTDESKDVLRIENRSKIGRVDVDFVEFFPADTP